MKRRTKMSIDNAGEDEWTQMKKDIKELGVVNAVAKEVLADPVERPEHYNKGGIEAIDGIKASMSDTEFRGYLKGNAVKYLWRYNYKNKPVEDLRKCRWYVDRLIQELI
jgi:hypothetical protein